MVLVCRAPKPQLHFMLYRVRVKVIIKDVYVFVVVSCFTSGLWWFYSSLCFSLFIKVDSQELQSGAKEVRFTVRVEEGNSTQLYCCLYKDQDGRYSAFSPYLTLEHENGMSVFFVCFLKSCL